ncbi:MAG: acyltransferase family protein [Acidobacteriaceae bacterium]
MPALTGLRAFTATNIVFFHFWNPAWFGPLAPMMDNGYVGVNFFFLLSGFILAYNYADRSDAGRFDRRQFWQTRFSRLYPVYVLGLLISFPILELEWRYRTHANFFLGLSLTTVMQQGWSPRLATFWNTPAWTLSCETVFYLLFPLLVAIKWPRQTRKLLLILAGCWLASLVLPVIYMWLRPDGLGPITRMSNSYWLRAVKMTPLPHLPTFTFGIVLSRLNDRMKLSNRARYVLAVVGVGSVCAVLMQGQRMPFLLMHNGLITPLFAITILGLTGHNPITRFLRLPLFVMVGEASYCLYILHFNLWDWIHRSGVLVRLHLMKYDPWISYFVLEVVALIVYRFLERPTRNWLHHVLPALKHGSAPFPPARVASPQIISAGQASEG